MVSCGFSLRKLFSPTPRTFINSSIFLNGPFFCRYSTMRAAVFAPMPGSPSRSLAEAVFRLTIAVEAGLAAVRAGAFGPDVDAASRVRIAEAGLGDAYGHGLGHGVGLDVHEAPALRPESTDTLAAGNVVTVEPGLYLPGVGGCRIEDLVVVTDDGCEILTSFTKEMLVLA